MQQPATVMPIVLVGLGTTSVAAMTAAPSAAARIARIARISTPRGSATALLPAWPHTHDIADDRGGGALV